MVYPTSKRKSNNGIMTAISKYKLQIALGHWPIGLGSDKIDKICAQVKARQEALEVLRKWSPKTARQDRRKKNQVGS